MMMMMMRPKEGNAKKVMRESERLAINDANEKERGKQKKSATKLKVANYCTTK